MVEAIKAVFWRQFEDENEMVVNVRYFFLRVFVLICCVMSGNVIAAERESVEPVIRYIVSGVEQEFDDPGSAFAAGKALRDYQGETVTHTMVNFRVWRSDSYVVTNGTDLYHVSDSYSCMLNPSSPCYLQDQGGPYVTSLSPRCPTDKVLVDGQLVGWNLETTRSDEHTATVRCFRPLPEKKEDPKSCPVGNPVYPSTGEKLQLDTDYRAASGLNFQRTYTSQSGQFNSVVHSRLVNNLISEQPYCLQSSFVENTAGNPIRLYCFRYVRTMQEIADVITPKGRRFIFDMAGDVATVRSGGNEKLLKRTGSGGANEWLFVSESNEIYLYNQLGKLVRSIPANAASDTTYRYSDETTPVSVAPRAGLLIAIADQHGRELTLAYDSMFRPIKMTDPAGGVFQYEYGANGTLTSVTYPDQTVRRYSYGEASNINGGGTCGEEPSTYSRLLTGIEDEAAARFADFRYACNGRAVSTEHAGGVDKFSVSSGSNTSTVISPAGTSRTAHYTELLGVLRETSSDQPAGAGCNASSQQTSYDPASGNVLSRNDFNGTRTCYAYDSRNLVVASVEGLAANAVCTVTAANAALPTGSRKTSSQWHPDLRLETKAAEPGQITTSVYNGQPDPFSGNAIASCAPTSALLPDGKRIAVLCKRVEQATTDANGAAGFSAALQAGVATRTWKWTYNEFGQVLTEDGPRTDVTDVTTYAYYTDTTAEHTKGDLKQVTNAAGKVTQYTKYNKHGQVLESLDPNGVLTVSTYDLRQRLLSMTVGGQATSYQYDPVGQLKRVTLPDASYVGYDYDDAHRLVAVYDHLGNRTTYELDNAGNRKSEKTTDPTNQLKRQLGRSIDALGRIQQTTGRE